MKTVSTLQPEQLYNHCSPDLFPFETTAELDGHIVAIGQARAEEAVRFGLGMQQRGYNLYALGPRGVGKNDAIEEYLARKAEQEPTPPDCCYIYNFDEPHQPRTLSLPPGMGLQLREDLEKLLAELQAVIPGAFESEEYQSQRQAIGEEYQQKQEEALETLAERARERDIALLRTQAGLAFAPMREGEVIPPDQFAELPEEERERVKGEIEELQAELQKIIRQVPNWTREGRERVKVLDEEIAGVAITPLFDELKQRYAEHEAVTEHLERMRRDVVENLDQFRSGGQNMMAQLQQAMGGDGGGPQRPQAADSPFFNRYKVNVLVDNSHTEGAPIVRENHPTMPNLIGRIEHTARMGALFTDFTLIKPGALHRANGGYLVLEARDLLMQPYSWDGLKRSLEAGEIRIESIGQTLGLISTVSLEPEPIPLDVKVVLLGERLLYYMLYQLDPDFRELFKVAADFEDEMVRNEENSGIYARLISTIAEENELRPFSREAVARVVEHSSRLAGDAQRLTTHTEAVADVLREADYWAGEEGNGVVQADDVQRALDAHVYRNSRIRERMQESILRETVLIDTSGKKIGQINGLAVLQVGDYAFGKPSRITARVRLGKGEVIDIERQVEMGGPIHSKGVLILTGFLGGRYADERPLSLSASLVMEQNYAGVEGDSASSAELYALLSALAEVPLKQTFAVTGSVNQHGQVQAIGGVNEKIEGFYDICRDRGLTGDQGVLIPASNVKNLMLRQDVVEAVSAGQFHVYPVETIDQGIELLTDMPAGVLDEEGQYPEGTFNHRVASRLAELAEKQRDFAKSSRANGSDKGENNRDGE